MAEKQSSKNSTSGCPVLRRIRRHNSLPAATTPNPPVPASPTGTSHPLSPTGTSHPLYSTNCNEVVPIEFDSLVLPALQPKDKEKMAGLHTSIQKNGQMTNIVRVATKNEAIPLVDSVQDVPNFIADTSPMSNVVFIESPDQGLLAKPGSKSDPAKYHFLVNNPKVEIVSPMKATPTKHSPRNDNGDKDEEPEQDNIADDSFSGYISRVKNKLRTTSSIGSETSASKIGRSASKINSFNDKVSTYIDRAKGKIRTASSTGGGGKSVSFK